jgi:hypothetical protein
VRAAGTIFEGQILEQFGSPGASTPNCRDNSDKLMWELFFFLSTTLLLFLVF